MLITFVPNTRSVMTEISELKAVSDLRRYLVASVRLQTRVHVLLHGQHVL